ncbi:hypothetical protein Q9R46_14395 [Paenibacillus sp. RRE4]|nr:hypothetical protein [Paenibacillus sp. RRE4]MDT0123847.1 hypothetical protein [Paenibacillus sp. RRE4]
MNQKIARLLGTNLAKGAKKSSKKRKIIVGAMKMPEELKKK